MSTTAQARVFSGDLPWGSLRDVGKTDGPGTVQIGGDEHGQPGSPVTMVTLTPLNAQHPETVGDAEQGNRLR